MKFKSILLSLLALVALLFTSTAFAQEVNVYRLYNGATGEHLYTTDQNEVTVLSTQQGWTDEGIGWKAPDSGESVFRLYNDGLKDHLYTKDTNEISSLVAGRTWTQDYNAQPLFYSGGTIPIYRLYNEQTGRHHLTTDENEYNTLPSQGWKQEGHPLAAVGQGESKPASRQVVVNLNVESNPMVGFPFDLNEIVNVPFKVTIQSPGSTSSDGLPDLRDVGTFIADANHQITLTNPEAGQYSMVYYAEDPTAYTGFFTISPETAANGGSVNAYLTSSKRS